MIAKRVHFDVPRKSGRTAVKTQGERHETKVPKEMHWSYWLQLKAEDALSHLKWEIFANIVKLADESQHHVPAMQ